jgi:predicted MPP superfamily phosphohydrolase
VAAIVLAMVVLRRWQASRLVVAAAAMGLVPAVVGVYATHVEPRWLRVDREVVPVAADRSGDDDVRVGVLADLQTDDVGGPEERAVDELMAASPDVILLPGDLFQGGEGPLRRELPALRSLLGRLSAPGGVWFVRGDSEKGDRADTILEGLDVTILDDEVRDVRVGDRTLRIGGTRLAFWEDTAITARRELEGTLDGSEWDPDPGATDDAPDDDGTIRILMAHRPDVALSLPPSSRVDLTVAGHTHGGQIVVPGFGPPVALSEVPRDVARGGLHDLDGNRIYVSPGVGLERGQAPQVRLFDRPAIGILDLRDGA